jgi:hypothetical protein
MGHVLTFAWTGVVVVVAVFPLLFVIAGSAEPDRCVGAAMKPTADARALHAEP